MQSFLYKLSTLWSEKIHHRIESFIGFFGLFWLLLSGAILYLLAQLSDEVLEQEAFAFDKPILLYIHQFSNPLLDRIMLAITRIGDPRTVVPITLAVIGLLWWRRHRLEAKYFALDAAGGAFLSYMLKLAFQKPRPQLWPQLINETTFSYPSGHALGSMVLYGFLSYLLASIYPRYAKAFYAVASVLILAIGLSRLYLGVHWPTDIIAGYSVGFLWVFACIALLRFQKRKFSL